MSKIYHNPVKNELILLDAIDSTFDVVSLLWSTETDAGLRHYSAVDYQNILKHLELFYIGEL